MEKLLNKALIIVTTLLVAIIVTAVMSVQFWLVGDYGNVVWFIGIMFILFGLMVYTFRIAMFPDEGAEDL